MIRTGLFVIFSWLFSSAAAQSEQMILFNMSSHGYPPYMIKAEAGAKPRGIMLEVLQHIAEKRGFTVVPIGVPKNREDPMLLSGQLDASPLAIEWSSHPDKFVFTDVIVEAKDVLFYPKDKPVKFKQIEDLHGMRLGTHIGYSYPSLKSEFEGGRITRRDENNEIAMLRMALIGGTDAAVVNELVGLWLIKERPDWHNKFALSKKVIGGFGYRIMFSKKWADFVKAFNQDFREMKAQGELDMIQANYR